MFGWVQFFAVYLTTNHYTLYLRQDFWKSHLGGRGGNNWWEEGGVFFVSLKKYCNTLFLLLFFNVGFDIINLFSVFYKKKRQNRAAKKADFFFSFAWSTSQETTKYFWRQKFKQLNLTWRDRGIENKGRNSLNSMKN